MKIHVQKLWVSEHTIEAPDNLTTEALENWLVKHTETLSFHTGYVELTETACFDEEFFEFCNW